MSSKSALPSSFDVAGYPIPSVGLGTFQGGGGNNLFVKEAVLKALKCGYRHIDTAAAYGNEREVGEAIQGSGIPRDQIFITTKLNNTWHKPADVEEALDRSLQAMKIDYVDLYLMHFPYAYCADQDHGTLRHPDGKPRMDIDLSRSYPDTWKAMEDMVDKGKTRLIGMSNFNIIKLEKILECCRIRPAALQVEMHPYLPQQKLLEYCTNGGIHVMAHQPLGGKPIAAVNPNSGHPGPLVDPVIIDIASSYKISPAQVLLSWAVQRGTSVVPKSVNEGRMRENISLVRLEEKHVDQINSISEKVTVRYLDPKDYVGFDIFNEEADEPVET